MFVNSSKKVIESEYTVAEICLCCENLRVDSAPTSQYSCSKVLCYISSYQNKCCVLKNHRYFCPQSVGARTFSKRPELNSAGMWTSRARAESPVLETNH